MPNRILREGIIESERVNALSPGAEILYRRLMSKVDDYGRFYGHPSLILAACYPLQLDRITQANVSKWLAECAQVINCYEVEGKKYIEIINFNQRTRTPSKFPPPPKGGLNASIVRANGEHVDGGLQARARARSESETYSNAESESESEAHANALALARVACAPQAADLNGQTSSRFPEFWERYPRQQRKDFACREWLSRVSVDCEDSVFDCLARYLASDEVARGVVMNPDKWLYEQGRANWEGSWPPKRQPNSEKFNAIKYIDEVMPS